MILAAIALWANLVGAPAPAAGELYTFCEIHYNYEPPEYKFYNDIYFVSAIVKDPQLRPSKSPFGPPTTSTQQGLVARVKAWAAARRYTFSEGGETTGKPSSIETPECWTGATLAEVRKSYAWRVENLGGEAKETQVQ